MRWKQILTGVLLGAVLLAAWWAASQKAEPLSVPVPSASVEVADAGVREVVPPMETREAADAGLWLRATLEGEHPFVGEARVGAAFISDEDLRWWKQGQARGEQAGPSRLEELANVRGWLTAPVTASAQGGVLGPVEVPPAPRYQLVAFEPDGTFWWGDHVPASPPESGSLDAGVLRATRPTGVRVRLAGARDEAGAFSVRIERDVDPEGAERASALLVVLRLVAPELMVALQDGLPVPLVKDGDTALAPLPPDRAVRLWLRAPSGREGGPVDVPLREGTVGTVTLDVARLFPEGVGGTVTLRGRVLLGQTSRPAGPAVLRTEEGREVPVDAEGRFTVPDVPTWRASRFTVWREEREAGRPVAPSHAEFTFTPTAETAGTAEVVWRMPVYRWLVLRMDGFTRAQLQAQAQSPYPVYLLQRRDARGAWSDVAAQEFIPEKDDVVVSLLEPGTYRVLTASSPYALRPSTEARAGADDADVEVRLSAEDAPAPSCEVRVTHEGSPVVGALVTADGGDRSMPPVRGETRTDGRWALGPVRSELLQVRVQAEGHAAWEGDGVEACRRSGVIEVKL
ncbi:carboxypeptidase regulatory-like domain-containing protein [Corallococcus sp. bb12-1]|uniref:carboxypeptidase regulatory-like domain-containing protein n=1 Tax=Corallococcus sp. bb12-1 TaxID=2996784 RepID=UPI002270D3B9|nr:carboxypeptidase regulatory-like domain-containing protein [Corallococcus sp. bb12-1]MCY1040262.1 carboxypeptidase regulatory-like domain-containing protein [Corallococcus sp. bb12-1]